MKQIAHELGFADAAAFSHFIRAETGATAAVFRRDVRAATAGAPSRGRRMNPTRSE